MVVYHCFGGTHSSAVAAAIHAGLLPDDRLPTAPELLAVPLFDRTSPSARGRPVEVGQDVAGRRVFAMGRGPAGHVAVQALRCGFELAVDGREAPGAGLLLVDTMPCVNAWMRIGGFLSRRLGLVGLGRPLVIWGTRRAYPDLVALVRQVRRQLEGPGGQRDTQAPGDAGD